MKYTNQYRFLLACGIVAMMSLWMPPSVAAAATSADKADQAMGHGSAEEVVVAKVNGKTINMAELMRAMADISQTKHGSEEVSPLLAEKIKQEATEKLITEELAFQTAAATIKTIPPDRLADKIQAVKKKYKDEEGFQQYITDQFGGMEGFRKQIERFLTLELFITQEFDAKVKVSDQEVEKAYNQLKSQRYVTDEFVQVNDLIFFLDPNAPDSAATIEKIKQTIIDKYDNDPRRLPTDGTFALEKNMPLDKVKNSALYAAGKGLKEYGWSNPINVDGNLHIVQLIGFKPAVNKSLQDVAQSLKNELRQQKRQAMINTWMSGLKKGAAIEIMDLTR